MRNKYGIYRIDDGDNGVDIVILKLNGGTITFGNDRRYNKIINFDGEFHISKWNLGYSGCKIIKDKYVYIENCKYIYGSVGKFKEIFRFGSSFRFRRSIGEYKSVEIEDELLATNENEKKVLLIISKKQRFLSFIIGKKVIHIKVSKRILLSLLENPHGYGFGKIHTGLKVKNNL